MGCTSSKPPAPAGTPTGKPAPESASSEEGFDELVNRRKSVAVQSAELDGGDDFAQLAFDSSKIGTFTRHGISPMAHGSRVGKAKINQDRGCVCWPFNGSHNQALLAVFDGHGLSGEKVSEWCMQQIPPRIEAERELLAKDPSACISSVVIKLDKELLSYQSQLRPIALNAGTTSNILYFRGNNLWVGCTGDSRAVLGRRAKGKINAFDLSNDHKPDLVDEQARIERMGGRVSPPGPRGLPPSRVWVNGRVGLAMSRSLGDGEAKGYGVIPDPEMTFTTITPSADDKGDGDAFVIVASDGIWEFISSLEACQLVEKHTGKPNGATTACEALVKMAEVRWQQEEGAYRDDITCIVAYLPFVEERDDDEEKLSTNEQINIQMNTNTMSQSILKQGSAAKTGENTQAEDEGDDDDDGAEFIKRRLSVAGGGFGFGQDGDYKA